MFALEYHFILRGDNNVILEPHGMVVDFCKNMSGSFASVMNIRLEISFLFTGGYDVTLGLGVAKDILRLNWFESYRKIGKFFAPMSTILICLVLVLVHCHFLKTGHASLPIPQRRLQHLLWHLRGR